MPMTTVLQRRLNFYLRRQYRLRPSKYQCVTVSAVYVIRRKLWQNYSKINYVVCWQELVEELVRVLM